MKRTSKKDIQKTRVSKKKQQIVGKQLERSFFQKNTKYLFLIFILFSIGVHLYNEITGNEVFETLQAVLKIPTVILGIVSLYFDKTKLNDIVNNIFANRGETHFSRKEFLTTLLFVVILGISVFTLFYKLDNFDLYSDEITVTRGAAGYFHTGEYKQWDFVRKELVEKPYNRAKPHQFIVAQSFKAFGVNAWSARFPSALFGVLLIIFMYFFGTYFIKDKSAALLAIFSFALYVQFLSLGRWARMYALVFPAFMLAYYWTFKFLTEQNTFKLFNSGKYPILQKYFNFNYIFLPFLLILLVINLFTHQNTTIIFPVFLIFSVISIFLFAKEKKYITASLIAVGILIFQIVNPYKVGFGRFTFFEINHVKHYTNILFGYPFSAQINTVFLFVGLFIFAITKNEKFKKVYLAFFITAGLTWVLFSYVFNYPPHFRYVSFITPLIVLLIFGIYSLVSKTLFNKKIQLFLVVLVISSASVHFKNNFNSLYVENTSSPAKPSVAYKTIKRNIKEKDVVFRHWGPKLYLEGISPDTKFISLGSYNGRPFAELYNDLINNKSGWITWHTHNGGRVDTQFQNYVNLYFKKYNGYGIDKTGVEVFYYSQNMNVPMTQFFAQQYLPAANLNLKNSYSLSFKIALNPFSDGVLSSFKSDSLDDVRFVVFGDSLYVEDSSKQKILSAKLNRETVNNIVWFQNAKNNKIIQGLFLNGKLVTEKEVKPEFGIVKFKVNPLYRGSIDKIRLYDFILNKEQIRAVISDNRKKESSEVLHANNKEFNTLYLWQKK